MATQGDPELDLSVKLKTRTVLLVLVEIALSIPVIMMFWWVFGYMGGVGWSTTTTYKFNWHPIAMIIGMFFLFGNAVVAFRLFPFNLKTNKWIHAVLHLLAVGFIIFGLVAVFEYHSDWGYTDLYSLHSWIGIVTSVGYITWALLSVGVFQDIDPRKYTWLRKWYKPIHIVVGMFLLFGAICAIETGIYEKAFFRLFSGYLDYTNYSTESWLVNIMCLSILVALLFLIYVLYTIPKIMVSSAAKPDDRKPIIALEEVNQKAGLVAEGGTEFGSMSDNVTPMGEPTN